MNTSYFPPFAILKEGLRISDDGSAVTMSRDLFNKLIASAVRSEFDPVWYRRENPDIAAAVAAGNPINETGDFEGRAGDADMEAEIEMWFNVILSSQTLRGAKERAGAESREPSLN